MAAGQVVWFNRRIRSTGGKFIAATAFSGEETPDAGNPARLPPR